MGPKVQFALLGLSPRGGSRFVIPNAGQIVLSELCNLPS